MIGHADQRYFYFGKTAARLDDVANYFPSRLTALALAMAAGIGSATSAKSALSIWQRDGGKHKSPNAGQPESAMAGALQVRLGAIIRTRASPSPRRFSERSSSSRSFLTQNELSGWS